MKLFTSTVVSPIGQIYLAASDSGLHILELGEHAESRFKTRIKKTYPEGKIHHEPSFFSPVFQQLNEYFARKRTVFELPLSPAGTRFQQAVWRELLKIPFGEVRSYSDLALALNKPGAARAVGHANGQNPVSIIIPCHRVTGTDGRLTGYAGGLNVKRILLIHEGADSGRTGLLF